MYHEYNSISGLMLYAILNSAFFQTRRNSLLNSVNDLYKFLNIGYNLRSILQVKFSNRLKFQEIYNHYPTRKSLPYT